jgi:hypothetical protein
MTSSIRLLYFLSLSLVVAGLSILCLAQPSAVAGPKPETYWQVEDVREGMKGHGRTVMKGTKVETFQAEVLGILKNTSPGRDLVLCRLSGLNLDHTGVIAGMSGSPVYIDNKLLGAVAYAWAYGKEPIAGITPFCQMHGFVEAYEKRDLVEQTQPRRVGLSKPVLIDGREFSSVTVSESFDDPRPASADGLWLVPLRTPLAATGFSANSLKLLRERCSSWGMVPMQGGGASAKVADAEKDTPLVPGGPLAIAMITGDFDLSGIGTVTHIEGDRVYGWGHPFMGLGSCDFPLMTGYIHTIYPRQTVSFKMGSPLRCVGIINADVSTGIAGWLGRKPDMMPVTMSVSLGGDKGSTKTFHVNVARQKALLPTLVFTALANGVDMEGELPEELTARLNARVHLEGVKEPITIQDTFSGISGNRAPQHLFGQVASVVQLLTYNPYQTVRISHIDCDTVVTAGRLTAEVEAIELESETYAPGETLRGQVFVRPYKGELERIPVALPLPADLPEGSYTVTAYDDTACARQHIRDNPTLFNPQTVEQVMESLRVQLAARRTNLVLRVPVGASGVAVSGKALPDLPSSMVHILGHSRRTGSQTISGSLVARHPTSWVIQGVETASFTVAKQKKVTGSN